MQSEEHMRDKLIASRNFLNHIYKSPVEEVSDIIGSASYEEKHCLATVIHWIVTGQIPLRPSAMKEVGKSTLHHLRKEFKGMTVIHVNQDLDRKLINFNTVYHHLLQPLFQVD